MKLSTIIMAAALATTGSFAFAQSYEPAPIGSDADRGNGAVINRGPVPTVGQDLDYQNNRSRTTVGQAPREYRDMRDDRPLYAPSFPDAEQAAPAGR